MLGFDSYFIYAETSKESGPAKDYATLYHDFGKKVFGPFVSTLVLCACRTSNFVAVVVVVAPLVRLARFKPRVTQKMSEKRTSYEGEFVIVGSLFFFL